MKTVDIHGAGRCPFHHASTEPEDEPLQARFTCPFELSARKEGKILNLSLPDDRDERLRLLEQSYEAFYADRTIAGMCLVLPDSFQEKASGLVETKELILPYQSEVLGTEVAYRFRRFWGQDLSQIDRGGLSTIEMNRMLCVILLKNKIVETGGLCNGKAGELAEWILAELSHRSEQGSAMPSIQINDFRDQLPELKISTGGVEVMGEATAEYARTDECLNTFSLVKTPFYPETFGRYAARIQIWVTRSTDFFRLTEAARSKIRRSANGPLVEARAIPFSAIENGAQHGGVWIPQGAWPGALPID